MDDINKEEFYENSFNKEKGIINMSKLSYIFYNKEKEFVTYLLNENWWNDFTILRYPHIRLLCMTIEA